MKELLDKISSYNIFNYLLPGVLYVFIVSKITDIDLVQKDLLIGAFFYYFLGLIISRIGSLIIEPILKSISFVEFADYKDFVQASKNDSKIEVLSETNNMYRTLVSLFLLIFLTKLYWHLELRYPLLKEWIIIILIILLILMFLFAYRKQTTYITKRIKSNLK